MINSWKKSRKKRQRVIGTPVNKEKALGLVDYMPT